MTSVQHKDKRGSKTYPDAHVAVRRTSNAIVGDYGRAGQLVNRTNVILCLSFYGHVSHESRQSKTPTVLRTARLVQIPHNEIAVSSACQYLVAIIYW